MTDVVALRYRSQGLPRLVNFSFTVVPASAILLVRKREDYYDEEEVVVDQYIACKSRDDGALAGY